MSILLLVTVKPAPGQTFAVLHDFTGRSDGANPAVGLTIDAAGRLYGTTAAGGADYGGVFEMRRAGNGWIFAPIYSFLGGPDGANPEGRVIFGPNGSFYGTTAQGGTGTSCMGGCGTVYNLRPPARACTHALCPWTETVIYSFATDNSSDALAPYGDLVFDSTGNAYGTGAGGLQHDGAVYQLTPSNGSWTEQVIYSFLGSPNDGAYPITGPILNSTGTLYGVTADGGESNGGVVYQLSRSGSQWIENVIHSFLPITDGTFPSGVLADAAGNLYGGTTYSGPYDNGSIWELSASGGGWSFSVLSENEFTVCGVAGLLTRDTAGNLYGVTCNAVFELSPSGDGWTYRWLYRFTGGADGGTPNGSPVIDANGNIYGTTFYGGTGNCFRGCGVVWEITP